MEQLNFTPITKSIALEYGLWTTTPQAISPWVYKQIKQQSLKDLNKVYEETWDNPILKIKQGK